MLKKPYININQTELSFNKEYISPEPLPEKSPMVKQKLSTDEIIIDKLKNDPDLLYSTQIILKKYQKDFNDNNVHKLSLDFMHSIFNEFIILKKTKNIAAFNKINKKTYYNFFIATLDLLKNNNEIFKKFDDDFVKYIEENLKYKFDEKNIVQDIAEYYGTIINSNENKEVLYKDKMHHFYD